MPDVSFCSEHLLLNMCDNLFVLLLCLTSYINSLVSVLVIQTVEVEEPGVRQVFDFSLHNRNMICLPVQITYFVM